MPEMLANPRARMTYQFLTLNGCLGEGWQTKLREVSLCVTRHDHGEWAKVVTAVREYRPSLLARVKDAVIDWLNG